MKKTVFILLALVGLCSTGFGQAFYLKHDKTGQVYGPFELKNGEKIQVHSTSFTIVTGKVGTASTQVKKSLSPANAIMVIVPYRHAGTWVFDDPTTGLVKEPFVAGVPQIIDKLVKDIPNAGKGFRLLFSGSPFPGHTHKMEWKKAHAGGHWYYSKDFKMSGWLCPALFKYFKRPPREIYVKAEAKK